MTLSLLIGSEVEPTVTLDEFKAQVTELLDLLETDFKAIKGRLGTVDQYTGLTDKQRSFLGQASGRAGIGKDRIEAFKEAIK